MLKHCVIILAMLVMLGTICSAQFYETCNMSSSEMCELMSAMMSSEINGNLSINNIDYVVFKPSNSDIWTIKINSSTI